MSLMDDLAGCSFRPTAEFSRLRSLNKLYLHAVDITGDELGCLLCNSFALKRLEIRYCDGIICLKVPFMLQRLRYLEVFGCGQLKMIDSKAPNISSFSYEGDHIQLSLGETLQMKKLDIFFHGAVHYARMINTPMLNSKYLHLKKLNIVLSATTFPPTYDYFSLVSFFDACPSLETLVLNVSQRKMEHISIFTDPLDLRKMPGQQHHKMKRVKILEFTSAKSLVELTCHIVESITSLERLTLEAHQSSFKCYVPTHNCSKCSPLPIDVLMEAQRAVLAIRTYVKPKVPSMVKPKVPSMVKLRVVQRAVLAIRTYVEPKVPSMVKLRVVEPCRRCHAVEL
uniref:At1g61320/AtMIF1 LRR domain-containing protein n=1 Tax=Setaria italica TaxID=4555 RepID=K3YBZ5_SETIT